MSDVNEPTKTAGATETTLSVLLEEASGPVSPRYQYTLRVALEPKADGAAALSVEATGAHGLGDEDASYQGTMSAADVATLVGELDAMAAFDASRDFLGPEGRNRVGVSFNALTLARGDRKARIDYFLSSLKRDDAEPQRRVVARIKELAKRAFVKALREARRGTDADAEAGSAPPRAAMLRRHA